MHHGLLQDLAIIMLVASVVTILFRRLQQPVVLGYILAGLIIGPHTPPFPLVQDEHTIETLAELGVVLLMFSLGLHFSVRNLARVGATASIAASLEILLMVALGYGTGRLFGWSPMDSLFLGAILSISSTTIIVKALEDLGRMKERFATITFGILVIEDIAAIVILAVLSGIATTGELGLTEFLDTLMKLSVFLAVVLIAGLIVVPRLLRYLSRYRSNEMMVVALLGLCFGVALLAQSFGYSVALGAFLIGAVVAESREGPRAAELIEPVRDMFSAVFFVAVGMMIDPQVLIEYAVPIAVVTLVVVFGKVFACTLGALLGGGDGRTALRVGMSLAQIGEFSFIIAALGQSLGVTSSFLYPIAVTVSALTTLSTPYLIRFSDVFADYLKRTLPDFILQPARLYMRMRPLDALSRRPNDMVRQVLRRSLLQVALNVLLIAGLFLLASGLERWHPAWLPSLPAWAGGTRTLLWVVAVALALPLCVAVIRKLQAVSMILAELSLPHGGDAPQRYAQRSMLTAVLLFSFSTIFAVALLAMSSALLPPLPVLVVLAAALAYLTYRLWGHFVRVYARGQSALRETFAEADAAAAERPLTDLFRRAEVQVVEIGESSRACHRLIRELDLRARTGATIVGIERKGEITMNPSPHDEIIAGDKLLLLGDRQQLDAAMALFEGLCT